MGNTSAMNKCKAGNNGACYIVFNDAAIVECYRLFLLCRKMWRRIFRTS